jgi:hypothetical protein
MKVALFVLSIVIAILVIVVISTLNAINIYIHPPRSVSQETPEKYEYEYESPKIVTEDGIRLSAWYIPAERKTNNSVLVLHGYPFDKGNVLGLATFLHKDFNLLLIDFRALGQSEGDFSSLGYHEKKDVKAAVEYLEKKKQNIGILGFSLGASTALAALPEINVTAIVADSPYASLEKMAERVYGVPPPINKLFVMATKTMAKIWPGIDISKVSPLKSIKNTSTPILLIHGTEDDQIPIENSQLLARAAKNAELWTLPAGHGYAHSSYPKEYEEEVTEFFEEHLK